MEARDLTLLRVLAETRNITRAAARLYMTQSAVSKRLKSLERELGAVLLVRTHSGVRFTPAGEAVLAYGEQARRRMEELHKTLAALDQTPGGTIRVGTVLPYALGRLPGCAAAFARTFPAVRLKICIGTDGELQQKLLDGELDLAVTTTACRWTGPRHFLFREALCVAGAGSRRDNGLRTRPYLAYPLESLQENEVRLWLQENQLELPPLERPLDLAVCRELVRSGAGWSLLPESLVPEGTFAVPAVFASGEPLCLPLTLLCQSYLEELPILQQFVTLIKKKHL